MGCASSQGSEPLSTHHEEIRQIVLGNQPFPGAAEVVRWAVRQNKVMETDAVAVYYCKGTADAKRYGPECFKMGSHSVVAVHKKSQRVVGVSLHDPPDKGLVKVLPSTPTATTPKSSSTALAHVSVTIKGATGVLDLWHLLRSILQLDGKSEITFDTIDYMVNHPEQSAAFAHIWSSCAWSPSSFVGRMDGLILNRGGSPKCIVRPLSS